MRLAFGETLRVRLAHDQPCCFDVLDRRGTDSPVARTILVGSQLGRVYLVRHLRAGQPGRRGGFEFAECYNSNANFGVASVRVWRPVEPAGEFMFCAATLDGFIKVFSSAAPAPLFAVQFYSKPLRSLWADASKLLVFFVDEIEKHGLCALHFFADAGGRRERCKKVASPENPQNRRLRPLFLRRPAPRRACVGPPGVGRQGGVAEGRRRDARACGSSCSKTRSKSRCSATC